MAFITPLLNIVLSRLALVICILCIYFVVRSYWKRKRQSLDKPPDSIVLLLAHHAPLNPQYLSIVASRALQREIPAMDVNSDNNPVVEDPEAPAGDCVMGAAPHFLLSVGGSMFLVHSVPAPYVDPSEFREAFREPDVKAAIETHCAWFSVDSIGGEPTSDSYRSMGKIAAEFAGPECLAIYHPPTEKIVSVTPETAEDFQIKLRGESPIEALFGA